MDVVVGTIFLGLLLLLVFCALQPGLESLWLEAQRQEIEARKLADIQAAGTSARYQVDAIIARYGQMMAQTLAADEPSDPLEVIKLVENNYTILQEDNNVRY